MIYVKLEVTASIERQELEDYVRPLEFTVTAGGADDGEYTVGKIAGELLMFVQAQLDGEDLHRICDNDSMGMCEMHRILFTSNDDLRKFVGDPKAERVALLYQAVIHDKLRPYLQAILELIAGMLSQGCILTMWTRVFELTEAERTACGFEEEDELLFRRYGAESTFGLENPGGIEVADDFTVTEADQELVLAKWGHSGSVLKIHPPRRPEGPTTCEPKNMKVRELQEFLKRMDPECTLVCYAEDEGIQAPGHVFRLLEIGGVDRLKGQRGRIDGIPTINFTAEPAEPFAVLYVTTDF